MNRLSLDKQARIAALFLSNMWDRRIALQEGVSLNSVSRNLLWLGEACQRFHDKNDRHLNSTRLELDELSAINYAREKNLPQHLKSSPEHGMIWTWLAFDPDSKFLVTWHAGKQEPSDAQKFAIDLRARVATRSPQLTSDGLRVYPPAIQEAFGYEVRFATIVKDTDKMVWRQDDPQKPPLKQIRVTAKYGDLDEDAISTSGVERVNSTFRDEFARYNKMSRKHSKSFRHHCARLALFATAYNYVRMHSSIRCTPAMALGVIDKLWEIEDLIEAVRDTQYGPSPTGLSRAKPKPPPAPPES